MYCSEHSLVNGSQSDGIAVTLRCKRWRCEICAPFNRKRVTTLAQDGFPNTFITLTVNPANYSDADDRARQLVKAWRTVRRRALKRYGYKSLPFIAVFEATQRGEPHLHILCRVKWIDQKWLSEQMALETGAPIVDVRRVPDAAIAARYCAKYLGKDPETFTGCKRFWRSLDWLALRADPIPDERPLMDHWTTHRRLLADIAREMRAQGLAVREWPHKLIYGTMEDST